MSVRFTDTAEIASGAQTFRLSDMLAVSGAPTTTYLILDAMDRNEYTAAASGQVGYLSGNGHTLAINQRTSGDMRAAGISFHWDATANDYVSATYGALTAMTFTTSASLGSLTALSLFAAPSQSFADTYAANPSTLAYAYKNLYLGTADIAEQPADTAPNPANATPNGIAAIAQTFVGQTWNDNGCWVLASTIAAEAGSALPLTSAWVMSGVGNGPWFVAYDGNVSANASWTSTVRTGDIVGFVTAGRTGHITTCVAGSGATARLIDNADFGTNQANDGSANDLIIQPSHIASQEWAGVDPSTVVIYRLDTPVVTSTSTSFTLAGGTDTALAALFSASDPANRGIASYQVYTGNAADGLDLGGTVAHATSAAAAITVGALAAVDLLRAAAGGADTVTVRAFNGAYWGDWTTVAIDGVASTAAAPLTAPVATPVAAPVTPAVTTPVASATTVAATQAVTPEVFRFFDKVHGTQFITADTAERDTVISTRPDLAYEGIAMGAARAGDPAAAPVFRFFDTADGTHFFTTDATERRTILATRPDLVEEQSSLYEHLAAQAGDTAVYRFFDTADGTHFFTDSAPEAATIRLTRPDLTPEGIAFYAPAA